MKNSPENYTDNIGKERRRILAILGQAIASVWFWLFLLWGQAGAKGYKPQKRETMKLPAANTTGTISVEQAIVQRRTVRSFISKKLSLEELSQLLWAAQGITEKRGSFRAAPSAGALYPMDIYVVAGNACVDQLKVGVYHYEAREHMLSMMATEDLRDDLARASLSQMWMAKAPVNIIITAEYKRVCGKYGARVERYAMIEAGHIGQNLFLQAEALGLKAGIVGAFHAAEISKRLNLIRDHEPLIIMPVGFAA